MEAKTNHFSIGEDGAMYLDSIQLKRVKKCKLDCSEDWGLTELTVTMDVSLGGGEEDGREKG